MADNPERSLVEQVRAGHENAARELFRQNYPHVLKIVRNHHSVRHSEEDLCQMIFLRAFSKLDQYSGRLPLAHWLSRIAVNTCINEWKKEKHRPELREADFAQEADRFLDQIPDAESDDDPSRREAREVVARLLEVLTPEDKIVISLLHLDGHSVDEVSALTGFSRAVVKIRAFRARRKLQQTARHLRL